MILVAGGSGRLGTLVVQQLAARGLSMRVLTRDPERARHLIGDHIEIVMGDVRDSASLVAAIAGVEIVVSAIHGFAGPGGVSPASVDRDGNAKLIDAAARADAAVVLISVVGASPEHPMELFRMKYAAEQHLQKSGVPWTIVRSTAFLELWIELLRQTAGSSGRPLVFGRGDNPVNLVSVVDVAALVERAVTDPSTRSSILEIGGPQNLTFNDLAAKIQQAAAGTGKPRHVPRPMLHAMAALLGPLKPELARQARSALVLDSGAFTFDAASIHQRFPGLPSTTIGDVLANSARREG